MNWRVIARPLGYLLALFAACIALPIPFALAERGLPTLTAFMLGSAGTGGLAALLLLLSRGVQVNDTPKRREALMIVAICWLVGSFCCALPYLFAGTFPGFIDCWFEAASGITTTGASVLSEIEGLPRSILFWRAFTNWLGGIGFVVLVAALLPALGVGAKYLVSYEATSAKEGTLRPRIATTSRLLVMIYVGLSFVCFTLYWAGGMPWFDALCHTFATLATGGFSTQNDSFAGYGAYLQLIAIAFMFLAALDFSVYYRMVQRDFAFWRDPQFRLYVLVLGSGIGVVFVSLIWQGTVSAGQALLDSAFNCTSLSSVTGFASANYEEWPPIAQGVIMCLVLLGGCAGSTAGGLKMIRLIICMRWLARFIRHSFSPGQVVAVRVGGLAVDAETEDEIAGFVLLFLIWWMLAAMAVMAFGDDMLTAVTGSLACISNAGPGLGMVGPMDNFAGIHPGSKVVLTLLMLSGRLELLAFTALVTPGFWRR